MKLKEFIQKLETIAKKHGDDTEVIMADNMPVIDPIFLKNYPDKKNIVITDEKIKK